MNRRNSTAFSAASPIAIITFIRLVPAPPRRIEYYGPIIRRFFVELRVCNHISKTSSCAIFREKSFRNSSLEFVYLITWQSEHGRTGKTLAPAESRESKTKKLISHLTHADPRHANSGWLAFQSAHSGTLFTKVGREITQRNVVYWCPVFGTLNLSPKISC